MTTLRFKQIKPFTVKILGIALALIWLLLVVFYEAPLSQIIVLFLIAFILIGYQIHYEVDPSLKASKCFSLYNFSIIKQNYPLLDPEYIVVFRSSFSGSSEWGPVSALGNKTENSFYVIRLFRKTKRFDLYKTKSQEDAIQKGQDLGVHYNIPCHVKIP